MASLIFTIASSVGSTPEMAKKQVCSTVLVRPARPTSRAICRVDGVQLDPLGEDLLLHRARERVPDLVGGVRAVQQQRRPGCRMAQHVDPVQQAELVAADEAGLLDEVGRLDRLRAEAQVLTVCEPDFFES